MYGSNKRKTVIALDYDGTISLAPLFFRDIIERWRHAINFYIVTYRDANAYTDELREFEELSCHNKLSKEDKDKFSFCPYCGGELK